MKNFVKILTTLLIMFNTFECSRSCLDQKHTSQDDIRYQSQISDDSMNGDGSGYVITYFINELLTLKLMLLDNTLKDLDKEKIYNLLSNFEQVESILDGFNWSLHERYLELIYKYDNVYKKILLQKVQKEFLNNQSIKEILDEIIKEYDISFPDQMDFITLAPEETEILRKVIKSKRGLEIDVNINIILGSLFNDFYDKLDVQGKSKSDGSRSFFEELDFKAKTYFFDSDKVLNLIKLVVNNFNITDYLNKIVSEINSIKDEINSIKDDDSGSYNTLDQLIFNEENRATYISLDEPSKYKKYENYLNVNDIEETNKIINTLVNFSLSLEILENIDELPTLLQILKSKDTLFLENFNKVNKFILIKLSDYCVNKLSKIIFSEKYFDKIDKIIEILTYIITNIKNIENRSYLDFSSSESNLELLQEILSSYDNDISSNSFFNNQNDESLVDSQKKALFNLNIRDSNPYVNNLFSNQNIDEDPLQSNLSKNTHPSIIVEASL